MLADAVVGKVGYSTLAEVYHAGVPFGYVMRSNFRESEPMAAFIEKEMQGVYLKESEFSSGRWIAKLQDLLNLNRVQRAGNKWSRTNRSFYPGSDFEGSMDGFGMIQKIISGGQTGVDRAALDAAIKLTIPHGGWIPQGRLTEDGPLPPEYQLQETRSTSYADRTEKNVLDADATLIISRGPLTGGSEYTREMAIKHNRLWLHIDLKKIPAFQAAIAINDWISKKGIAILNVAGPRASKDPKIYKDTLNILESSYYLSLVQGGTAGDQSNI